MRYDPILHELIMEPKDCSTCMWQEPRGSYPGKRTCHACGGTGNGPRGGKGTCRGEKKAGTRLYDPCYRGQITDHLIRMSCPTCGGNWKGVETDSPYDHAPRGMLAGLIDAGFVGLRVIRQNREGTALERLLGMGLWSTTDYGDSWKQTDEQVREKVLKKIREDSGQAVKWTEPVERGALRVPVVTEIVVLLHRGGYSVVGAVRDKDGIKATYV